MMDDLSRFDGSLSVDDDVVDVTFQRITIKVQRFLTAEFG